MDDCKSFYYTNYILGLTPRKDPSKNLLKNIVGCTPCLLMGIIHFACLTFGFLHTESQSSVSKAANLVQFIPNSFSYLLWLANVLKAKGLFQSITKLLHSIDVQTRELFSNTVSSKRVKISSAVLTLAAFLWYIPFAYMLYAIRVKNGNATAFAYWISFTIPKLSLFLVLSQFSGFITLLTWRVRVINKGLRKHFSLQPKKKLDTKTGLLERKLTRIYVVPPIGMKMTQVEELPELLRTVQQCSKQITRYYGKQTLFTLLSGFISITVQLYFMIVLFKTTTLSISASFVIAISLILIAVHSLEFGTLMFVGTQAKEAWCGVRDTLKFLRIYAENKQMKEKFQDAIEAHEKRTIEFNAFNCFTIDFSLLTGVFSSITTYLIVLVQFKMTEDQESRGTETAPTKESHGNGMARMATISSGRATSPPASRPSASLDFIGI